MAAASHSYEAWAAHYIRTTSLRDKLAPPPDDLTWSDTPASSEPPTSSEPPAFGNMSAAAVPSTPGRPTQLRVAESGMRTPGKKALRAADKRAQLAHTFWHHELQAAELMCWALLRFRDTPKSFRRGLLAICRDEIRHMRQYQDYLQQLGFAVGDFPVRDWFWSRVPRCASPRSFVATMGIGLEGGNLDHTSRFAARFRAVGDEAGAQLQEQVGREEIAHVRFAMHWFRRFGEPRPEHESADFDVWRGELPPPLSPILMRGRPLDRSARRAAGMSDAFIDALADWRVDDPRAT